MKKNAKKIENEIEPNISEFSKLTNNNNNNKKVNKPKTNLNSMKILLFIIVRIIALIIILIIMYLLEPKSKMSISFNNYFNISLKQCNLTKTNNITSIYSDKWIVLTTNKNPTYHINLLLKVPEPWKIVVVENGKILNSNWEQYNSSKLIYLSIENQNSLCYQTTNYILIDSYSRKNIGYLYAIQHGAVEIFDTDDDFIYYKFDFLINNYTEWRLYYANNNSQMVNPYEFFGRPEIWPRGFRFGDTNKNNIKNYFSAMENQVISKPLIYQGVNNNYDLDSIFLSTRGNIYNKRDNNDKYINPHNINPLFYIPGNFVPINSKDTKILYEIFPALALPTTVSKRVSDIWRGYLMQRYAWGYNGVVFYIKNDGIYDGNIDNISELFNDEKDLYFKLDSLLNILKTTSFDYKNLHPAIFLGKLIEILVDKNILGENDLNMYKAFIVDLESFGYIYKNNYSLDIDSNIKKYLNLSTELQYYLPLRPDIHLNDKYYSNNKLLKHYSIKKYENILLMINYNYEYLIKLNNFIIELYHEYFPNIVFIYPNSNINITEDNNTILCPESDKGFYSYVCIQKVYSKYPNMKGYLFAMDDAFLKIWEFENFNFDIPWILYFYIVKTRNWITCNDRVIEMLNKKINWKNNLTKFYNSEIIGHGISDFFYLPNYFVKEYMEIAIEFYKQKIFLELAVPSIYGILLKPLYQLIYFNGLWDDNRKYWLKYLKIAHRQTVIHPIKFSNISSQIEVVKYLFFKNAKEY